MTNWNIQVSEDTDRAVRNILDRPDSDEHDLSEFVDRIVRAEILKRTIREIQDSNKDLSAEEAQALADEAVAWARANPA